jgi:uncharacterized membrane protein YkgB
VKVFEAMAHMDRWAVSITRWGLIVVLVWIGALKVERYEADGIVPMVANSPLMSFFYAHPAPEYRDHMNKEGDPAPANHVWHESNNTYPFALGLGSVIVAFALMLSLHRWLPQVAAVGGFLVFTMSLATLSFLVTTPEAWVPNLGGPEHGFPLLSGMGRLIVKDVIMMGAGLVVMADSAKAYLRKRNPTAAVSLHPSENPVLRHG